MSSTIYNISVDCADPWALARFWSDALDRPVHPDNEPGDDEVGVALTDTGEELLFIRVPEPQTVKNRLHLCLRPRSARDDEVERLLGLGATMADDRRNVEGGSWAVLLDPEGNEFCVLRSAAERAADKAAG